MLPLLIPELLFFTFLMIVDGEPLRFFLLRRFKFVSDLDLIQIIILDVFLGGFLLYIIAMLPFHLFSFPIVFGVTGACLLLSVATHFKALISLSSFAKIRASLTRNKRVSFEYVAVFAMLIIFLVINLVSVSGLVLGSVHDESVHSLYVEVILENKQVPVTLQPYLAEGIIYPQGSQVIFAYACYMLNMAVPEAVFYITILFKSLAILGAYFLGKKLFSRRAYYLGLSFVFAFVSSWPLYITWGGNPFVVGFPLFLISLGLLFTLIANTGEKNLAELTAIGLLFGYCAVLIVSYLETLIAAGVLIVAYSLIHWLTTKHNYLRRNLFTLLFVFLVSLLPLSPFLYRFFAFYQYPGHNIGVPSDFLGYPATQFYITQALQWAFQNLSPYTWLSILMISFLVGLGVLAARAWKTRAYKDIESQMAFALAIFAAAVLLSFVSFLLPTSFNVISWGHQGIILIVPVNIFIIIFYVKLKDLCSQYRVRSFAKIFSKDTYSGVLVAFMILLLINVPFVYSRLVSDPQTLSGAYGLYAVATEGDYNLMLWMKANLTSNAVVLVNPNEAGLFIPTISHQKIIYPWTGSSYSLSYETLVNLTLDNVLNGTTYGLMQKYNITDVFVGAAATGWWTGNFQWDPYLFLGNPNFKLIANFGNAYLFQFNYNPDLANIAFFDNFENANWSANGWQAGSEGNGQGNVTATADLGLKITAQAAYNVSEWQYATYISRKIFVLNDSDVNLSFNLNEAEGFSGRDTFAAIVSNIYGNQTFVITTPNSIYENYQHSTVLQGSAGSFDFNNSLSTLWRQAYGTSLPNPFVLEFVDWDFNGVQNVAYLDNVTVTTTPTR